MCAERNVITSKKGMWATEGWGLRGKKQWIKYQRGTYCCGGESESYISEQQREAPFLLATAPEAEYLHVTNHKQHAAVVGMVSLR